VTSRPQAPSAATLVALTSAALVGFAANSLLTRGAIAAGRIDPASFLSLRLGSGAVALWVLTALRGRHTGERHGSWRSAAALAGYGVGFTLAYSRIGAGLGALALFGAVQVTMLGAGWRSGERPHPLSAVGLAIAVAGLLTLTLPGASAPSLAGVALMAAAGACWGIYSLRGRRSSDPLASTARNFAMAFPVALVLSAVTWRSHHLTLSGAALAITSGAITSGVAYALWYAALPHLTAWRAGIVQLLTPVLTVAAAAVMLGEPLTARVLSAGALIVAGVGVALLSLAAARTPPTAARRPTP
jgi:drug/metabolite transporter (DMT)-like permease